MFAERLICSWIGAFGLAAGAFCQTYVQFSIDAGPIPGSINQNGEIAGTYVDFANGFHGFVRDPGGKITAFDAPGSFSSTRAISINAGGAITGTFIDTTPPVVRTRAYVRDPEGNFTTFDPPGSVSTVPQSINARGAISGYYNESNQRFFGFVRHPNGKITSIDPPGSISTQDFGINAKGAITGSYVDANQLRHGFLREPTGTIISFDVPEGTGTFPASINDAGAITGSISTPGHFPDPSLVLSALCAIQMGISRRSTLVLVTQSRRLSTTKERLRAFWKTLPWIFFTALCGRPRERVLCPTRRFAFSDRP